MGKKREILAKIAYCVFYLAVIIEILIVIVDKSALVNPVEGRLFQITFCLFFLKVCMTRYSWKEYLTIMIFVGVGAISYFVTGRNEIIRFVIFIAACKDVDMKKCLKLVFWMTLIGCVLIMLLAVTGIYGSVSLTQDYGRGGVETRYTLGMGHPNALQCMVWALTTLRLYLYGEKMKWYQYLLLLITNIGFYFLTDSKTSLFVSVFIILYAGIIKLTKSEEVKTLYCKMGFFFAIGSILLSVIIAVNAYHVYNYAWNIDRTIIPKFFAKLDGILTGRIRTLVGTTRWEGTVGTWKLFSEPANNYYFDMGWIRLFYWYGIIPAVVFIILMFLLMVYCTKQRNYMAVMLLTSFAVYSIIEAHAVSVYLARNYVLFLFGMYWCELIDIRKKWG